MSHDFIKSARFEKQCDEQRQDEVEKAFRVMMKKSQALIHTHTHTDTYTHTDTDTRTHKPGSMWLSLGNLNIWNLQRAAGLLPLLPLLLLT